MSELTPFHCWTEYWKAKEMFGSVFVESCIKDSQFLIRETNELADRIREWEVRHNIK